MKIPSIVATVLLAVALPWKVEAQIYDTNNEVVETFAGSGFSGYLDGVGQLTMFDNPVAVMADSSGNLFAWDNGNFRIREITPSGTVRTFAGNGYSGSFSPGFGTNASLGTYNICTTMTIDHSNALWLIFLGDASDDISSLIRIGPDGSVSSPTTLPGIATYGLYRPCGLCADSRNNIYFADTEGYKIYRYTTNGVFSVFAGSGNIGYADGNGVFTAFNSPTALAADAADNIYVWDSGNYRIRRIDQNQNVVTISGNGNPGNKDGSATNDSFGSVSAMCVDSSGNLILACGSCIREITPVTNVVTMAGSFTQSGYNNGAGSGALFSGGTGVCITQGTVFVADSSNQRIREISFNPSSQPVSGANLGLGLYPGLQITGIVGRAYQIQSSPDMQTWSLSATLLLNSSPYLWFDTNLATANKFYRAFLLP